MSGQETRRVVEGFLADCDTCWLADDVVLYDAARACTRRGRAAVVQHLVALDRVVDEDLVLIVEDGRASAHWLSAATSYEVSGGEITEIRTYYAGRCRVP